ncbi:MAG: carbonic anhydrase [Gemmatimonadetes bacterium]|nr:carbonic anhydrase [Gemmatimonadota bacterium]
MCHTDRFFAANRAWAWRLVEADPRAFERMAAGQAPEVLMVPSDLNALSVLQYAVEVLMVPHIVVCGHYGCGGVQASLAAPGHGAVARWLRRLRQVRRLHRAELAKLRGAARERRLVELNVIEQVRNVARSAVVRDAWEAGARTTVHGWVYDVSDGLLTPLCRQSHGGASLEIAPDGTTASCSSAT